MDKDKIFSQIKSEIDSNEVVLFMKGTANLPQCGFSGLIVQILNRLGVRFAAINVLENDEIRQGIKEYTNWPTIPQLYIKGEFVGGSDIVKEMFTSGELQSVLKDKGIKVNQ